MRATLSSFRRVTSGGRYIPELDGLRFVAIGLVFVQHLQQSLPQDKLPTFSMRLIADAHFGVELFFVISGFILAMPFKAQSIGQGYPVSLRGYYLRRLTRLEPPYVLHLLIVAAGLLLAGRALSDVAPHLLSSLLYISNFTDGRFHALAINAVTWSLEIEVQFYVLAPLLAVIFALKRWRTAVVILSIGAVFLIHHILKQIYGVALPTSLLEYFQYFAVGMLVADRYGQGNATSPRSDGIAILAWIALPLLFQLRPPGQSLVAATLLYLAVYHSLQSAYLRKAFAYPFIATIGGMCYSIYLLHMPVLHWLIPKVHLPGSGFPRLLLESLVYGLPVIAISALFFLLVEKPCMKRNWWRIALPRLRRLDFEGRAHPDRTV